MADRTSLAGWTAVAGAAGPRYPQSMLVRLATNPPAHDALTLALGVPSASAELPGTGRLDLERAGALAAGADVRIA